MRYTVIYFAGDQHRNISHEINNPICLCNNWEIISRCALACLASVFHLCMHLCAGQSAHINDCIPQDKQRPKGLVRSEKASMLRRELTEALALAAYDLSSPMVQEHSCGTGIPGWRGSQVTLASNSVPYRHTSLSPCGAKAIESPHKSDYSHDQRTKLVRRSDRLCV